MRIDTFGDEAQRSDTLRMHEVIPAALDPRTALSLGLKVGAEAPPAALVKGIQDGSVDLKSPATTVALIKLNAVVGLVGQAATVNGKDTLARVGAACGSMRRTSRMALRPPWATS